MPSKVILTSKKMKTPKFILNRTEDYLYHSKLWIIGYASLFYLCSIIRDCREMPKKVFDFPNELIDKVIEIS